MERLFPDVERQIDSFAGLAHRIHIADELHIAAERQPADLPSGAAPVCPAGDLPSEADRKFLGADPEQPRDPIMAELVKQHERADRAQEGDDNEP